MGSFATPDEVKARVKAMAIQEAESPDLDDVWIVPAERTIEKAYSLNLDTSGVPWHWRGIFVNNASKEADYRDDYRRAVILLIRRQAQNPYGYASQSVAGASVVYGHDMPPEVDVLMGEWGRGSAMQGTVFR